MLKHHISKVLHQCPHGLMQWAAYLHVCKLCVRVQACASKWMWVQAWMSKQVRVCVSRHMGLNECVGAMWVRMDAYLCKWACRPEQVCGCTRMHAGVQGWAWECELLSQTKRKRKKIWQQKCTKLKAPPLVCICDIRMDAE